MTVIITILRFLEFFVNGIEPAVGQHYEGWIIDSGGSVITSGRFNVNSNGDVFSVDVDGNQISQIGSNNIGVFNYQETGQNARSFVLTIEPNGDLDPSPSAVHLVGGDFTGTFAQAITSDSSAIDASFLTSSGSYILATPTTASISSDDNQGVWFLSSGAPPFPGQDYINPSLILNDGNYRIVITVEPSPDFDPAPFTIKILDSLIANGAPTATDLLLTNISNEDDIFINATLR